MLEVVFHLLNDLSELLSEDVAEKCTSHIKSLLSIVISVILHSPTEESLNESIRHITNKECLFEIIALLNTDMRKQIVPKKLLGILNTIFIPVPFSCGTIDLSSLLSNKIQALFLSLEHIVEYLL